MQRIVGAGLVGDQVWAYAARHQFRHDIGGVATQGNRDRFALLGVFIDTCEGVIQRVGLLIDVTGAQTEIDAALLALNIQGAGTCQGRCQRLCAPHPA